MKSLYQPDGISTRYRKPESFMASMVFIILACLYLTGCINRSGVIFEPDPKMPDSELKSTIADNPTDYLIPTMEEAIREKKNVFLIFGSPSCAPCKRFEKYLEDSSVHSIINKYFVVNSFDVIRTTKGKELYKKYWKMGMPSWTLLDKERNIIADSGNPSTGSNNIGYPHNAKDLAHFEHAIRLGAPTITESEMKVLTEKIIYYSPNKDQY